MSEKLPKDTRSRVERLLRDISVVTRGDNGISINGHNIVALLGSCAEELRALLVTEEEPCCPGIPGAHAFHSLTGGMFVCCRCGTFEYHITELGHMPHVGICVWGTIGGAP